MTPVRMLLSLALVLGLGACASGPGVRTGATGKDGAPGTPSPGATGSSQDGTPPAGSTQRGNAGSAGASAVPTDGRTPYTLQDVISAIPNENVPWGCKFRPGDSCRVPITGSYYLYSKTEGFIVFKAFENDAKNAVSTSAPLAAPKGGSPYQAVFPYTVGLTAKTVTFQGFLQDKSGKVLASAKPHSYPVTPAT